MGTAPITVRRVPTGCRPLFQRIPLRPRSCPPKDRLESRFRTASATTPSASFRVRRSRSRSERRRLRARFRGRSNRGSRRHRPGRRTAVAQVRLPHRPATTAVTPSACVRSQSGPMARRQVASLQVASLQVASRQVEAQATIRLRAQRRRDRYRFPRIHRATRRRFRSTRRSQHRPQRHASGRLP